MTSCAGQEPPRCLAKVARASGTLLRRRFEVSKVGTNTDAPVWQMCHEFECLNMFFEPSEMGQDFLSSENLVLGQDGIFNK